MKTLTPTREQIKELMNHPDDKPFVMINLLRFKSDEHGNKDGRKSYYKYTAAVEPILNRIGGRVLWMGSVEQVFIGVENDIWDMVLLVEYPSRKAFVEMITSKEYIEAHRYREEGLVDSVLLAGTTILQA